MIFVIFGVITEIVGNLWLEKWDSDFNSLEYIIHVILISYPFVCFFSLELFVFIKNIFKSKNIILILPVSAFVFGYINEIPNTFAYEWKYKNLPLGEFLGVPILISFLWLLILLTLLFERFFIKSKKNFRRTSPKASLIF